MTRRPPHRSVRSASVEDEIVVVPPTRLTTQRHNTRVDGEIDEGHSPKMEAGASENSLSEVSAIGEGDTDRVGDIFETRLTTQRHNTRVDGETDEGHSPKMEAGVSENSLSEVSAIGEDVFQMADFFGTEHANKLTSALKHTFSEDEGGFQVDELAKSKSSKRKARTNAGKTTKKKRGTRQTWSPNSDKLLSKQVDVWGGKSWKNIALGVPGKTHVQCHQRYFKVLRPGLKRGKWNPEEDKLLLSLYADTIRETATSSKEPPSDIFIFRHISGRMEGRSSKQVRERWRNFLDPKIKKGKFSRTEDRLLFRLVRRHGTKWSMIATEMAGRTENSVKVRYRSLEKRNFCELNESSEQE